ncbi:uncharacterized protein M421DRAFT_337575 [Didymella exigua CBS 183.55]|uniref:Uncharacterized protein n=1 Tax=Didymella exigua CBS 183.55 TaxID=1150837 RepID=A0A6A5R6H7_9PLEO|nr:uncharacterized protein M421DRAFT_337575 [Didymella exigua CBS 183.55]KAF1922820.1 hypothetical protein M421DRAFT_337575 [Didymella exigua CBS 183.55]
MPRPRRYVMLKFSCRVREPKKPSSRARGMRLLHLLQGSSNFFTHFGTLARCPVCWTNFGVRAGREPTRRVSRIRCNHRRLTRSCNKDNADATTPSIPEYLSVPSGTSERAFGSEAVRLRIGSLNDTRLQHQADFLTILRLLPVPSIGQPQVHVPIRKLVCNLIRRIVFAAAIPVGQLQLLISNLLYSTCHAVLQSHRVKTLHALAPLPRTVKCHANVCSTHKPRCHRFSGSLFSRGCLLYGMASVALSTEALDAKLYPQLLAS